MMRTSNAFCLGASSLRAKPVETANALENVEAAPAPIEGLPVSDIKRVVLAYSGGLDTSVIAKSDLVNKGT
jgi:hypothetical protein